MKLKTLVRAGFLGLLLLSLAHSFIYPFLETPMENIECAENTGESEKESESEKEGVDDDFLPVLFLANYGELKDEICFDRHSLFPDQSYIDISTPPPETS